MFDEPLVVIPFRAPGAGKTRLSRELSKEERADLSVGMLIDVVGAVRGTGISDPVVAAAGVDAALVAIDLGLTVVPDPPDVASLDAAVENTIAAFDRGRDALVIMADLPGVRPSDVQAVLDCAAAVVLAPTADGGTGALLRRPAGAMQTAYGPNSAERHARLARERGLEIEILDLPGFAADVDTWDDVLHLGESQLGPFTTAALDRIGSARPA